MSRRNNAGNPAKAEKISFLGKLNQDMLRQDNILVESKLVSLADIAGMPTTKGLSQALICEGRIVNVVSPNYGYLPNDQFFGQVEQHLAKADVQYLTRAINRDNQSFAVDYILNDETFHVKIKTGDDEILPMLRFTNTYSGGPCTGTFGFFRKVCQNGLHVANTKIGFKCRHIGEIGEVSIRNIKETIQLFMENEYYSLHKKFEVLAETPIADLSEFVKYTCTKHNLFKYEASEKNPNEPSKRAKELIQSIQDEASILNTKPNLWLGYNAFNEYLHGSKKGFTSQRKLDSTIFESVLEMAN